MERRKISFQNPKKKGKKKMLHEVESLLAVLFYQTIKTLLIFLIMQYLLTNHRNIKGKIKKFVSFSPKNGTNIDLSVTSAFDPMSVDNTYDELVSTRAPIKIDKPFSRPATNNSSSASYTPRTDSTSPLYPNTTLPAASTSSSNIYNIVKSIYEGFDKMHSEFTVL